MRNLDMDSFVGAAKAAILALDPQSAHPKKWDNALADPASDEEGLFRLVVTMLRDVQKASSDVLKRLATADSHYSRMIEVLTPSLLAAASESPGREPEPSAGLQVVPSPEPAAEEPPAERAGRSATSALDGLDALIALSAGLPLDPADLAFISKGREMIEALGPQDADQEARILYNSVWQLEGLADRYRRGAALPGLGAAYDRFLNALSAQKSALAGRLEGAGYRLFPKETAGAISDLKAAVGEDALVEFPVYSDRKAGTIAGLKRSGVRTDQGIVEKAQVQVSQGPSEAASAIESAAVSLLSFRASDARERAMAGKSLKDISKLLSALPGQPDGYTFARFAVNALTELDGGGRLKDAVRGLLAYLEKGGFHEILVPVGETFDESFSPGKYERKRVPSDKPKDRILGVLQRGFLDSKGVCIQKAVVAVSKG